MATTSKRPKKSTNVRSSTWQVLLVRWTFQLLNRLAPPLAVRWAVRIFRSVRQFDRPPREQLWLRGAERRTLSYSRPPARIDEDRSTRLRRRAPRKLVTWSWESWAQEGAPVVVLVHGWEGRGSQMGAFAEPLVRAGYRVVAFDAPGHGESQGTLSSLPELAAALARVVEVYGPVDAVVAHSFGSAATGRALTHLNLATRRLVWISPPSDLEFYVDFLAGMLGLTPWVKEGMIRRIEESFDVHWDEARFATLRAARATPLLLVHDEDDRETTVADSELLVRAWPDARLLITRGLGHRRILRAPEVVDAVVDFIQVGRAGRKPLAVAS